MSQAPPLKLPRPFGPYELVQQLAVGNIAAVYMARARSVAGFEKIVALKMIHAQCTSDPEFTRLLVDEANLTAQLSHRNIVQVIDLGQVDGAHYVAMEFVDGLDLARLLARQRERGMVCTPRVAALIVREICDGLEYAHRKSDSEGRPLKIIHRDVSPQNILLSNTGEVKLTDFGIAKAALRATTTQSNAGKGKYAYMAPEQARGERPLDARADVYGAGALLYELATGQPLRPEQSVPKLLENITSGVYVPPERVRPELPPALVAILHRALAPAVADRYPTARAMADELNSFLFSLPPNPEGELVELLNALLGTPRASVPPMAMTSLVDDDSDDSTQIETMAAMRSKMSTVPRSVAPAVGVGGGDTGEATAPGKGKKQAPVPASVDAEFGDEPTRALRRRDLLPRAVAPASTPAPATIPAPANAPSIIPAPANAPATTPASASASAPPPAVIPAPPRVPARTPSTLPAPAVAPPRPSVVLPPARAPAVSSRPPPVFPKPVAPPHRRADPTPPVPLTTPRVAPPPPPRLPFPPRVTPSAPPVSPAFEAPPPFAPPPVYAPPALPVQQAFAAPPPLPPSLATQPRPTAAAAPAGQRVTLWLAVAFALLGVLALVFVVVTGR